MTQTHDRTLLEAEFIRLHPSPVARRALPAMTDDQLRISNALSDDQARRRLREAEQMIADPAA